MKKSLKILVLLALTTSSALASPGDYYAKINLNINEFNDKNKNLPNTSNASTATKSNTTESVGGGFALGMKINDNIYTDISWSIYGKIKKSMDYQTQETVTNNINIVNGAQITNTFNRTTEKGTLSLKSASLSSLMLGAYIDVFKFDKASLFLGAKAGAAFIEEEYKSIIGKISQNSSGVDAKLTKKKFTNPAVGVVGGLNWQLQDNISLDTAVGYHHYGKGKPGLDYTNKIKNARINYNMIYGEIGLKFHF